MLRRSACGVLAALVLPALAQPMAPAAGVVAAGGPAVQEAKLTTDTEAGPGDQFGASVAISGERALVGAWHSDFGGQNDSGSAYVFVRSGGAWSVEAQLTAGADATSFDQLGRSVALSGDLALVGMPNDDEGRPNSGSVLVFVRSGSSWTLEATLNAADAGQGDTFGFAVALDGDRALVGAPSDDNDNGQANLGSAYVFVRSGASWTQEAKLTATDASASDTFGYSVALDGDRALIGAYRDDDYGQFSGSAYVFVRSGSTWTQEAKLGGSVAGPSDGFGSSVALDGNRALIGSPQNKANGQTDSGSAYVYMRSGASWALEDELTVQGSAGDGLGTSVALDGDHALVGTPSDDDNGQTDSGTVYVFSRSGTSWTQTEALTAADAGFGDGFGTSVSLDDDLALIGAIFDDDGQTDSGSAYVFGLGPVSTADGPAAAVELSAPTPNPATRIATLALSLDELQTVRATVLDALGREVAVVMDDVVAGQATLAVPTAGLAPGVYSVRVTGRTFAVVRRLTVVH